MDVSGDSTSGNYKYLGVVLGTSESIGKLRRKLGKLRSHMTRLNPIEQNHIIDNLVFNNKNCIAYCIKLDRQKVLQEVKTIKIRKKRIPKGNLLRLFNRILMEKLKPEILKFTLQHGISINELQIQCDTDSIPFLKSGAIKHEREGFAYVLSDIVAWCNNKNRDLIGITEIDFTSEVIEKMKKNLLNK